MKCCFCKGCFAQLEIPVFLIDDKAAHSKCWLDWREKNDPLTTDLPPCPDEQVKN